MSCSKCGRPSFSVEKNHDVETRVAHDCRECWWASQVARIDRLFAGMELTDTNSYEFQYPRGCGELSLLDPGMTRGEKRRVNRAHGRTS